MVSHIAWRTVPSCLNRNSSSMALLAKCFKIKTIRTTPKAERRGIPSARCPSARVTKNANRPPQGWCIYHICGIPRRLSLCLRNVQLAFPGPDTADGLCDHRCDRFWTESQATGCERDDVGELPVRAPWNR